MRPHQLWPDIRHADKIDRGILDKKLVLRPRPPEDT